METLLATLKGLSEETRLRILALLCHGELTVSELTTILGQSQPRISRHLKVMVDAGLLTRFREGTWVFYRLGDQPEVRDLIQRVVVLIPQGDGEYARDTARLEEAREARGEVAKRYFAKHAKDWGETRALYVAEATVEAAMQGITADQTIDNLIDIGTGTGRILDIFKDRIRQGIGIDLSMEMIAVARANLSKSFHADNCTVRHGDMYNLPIESGTQDLAVFHQVLHFSDEPERAVQEAARVLRPKGAILVVDFAPHMLEDLRENHAHRRLGFTDDEVASWGAAAKVSLVKTRSLKGGQLVVKIWYLSKSKALA